MRRTLAALAAVACLVGACGSSTISPGPDQPGSPTVAASPVSTTVPSATVPSAAGSESASAAPTTAPVTAPPPTPVGSSVDAAPCAPGGVSLDVKGEPSGTAVLLVIDVTNTGSTLCALTGAPASIGLRAGGGSLPTTYEARQDPWPGDTPDAVAPPVVLPPHGKARARAIWRNWCDGLPADVSTVWVGFGAESLDTSPEPFISPPPCENQAAESAVQGYPFQADTSGG
jgi:hypothetical protein